MKTVTLNSPRFILEKLLRERFDKEFWSDGAGVIGPDQMSYTDKEGRNDLFEKWLVKNGFATNK